MFSWWNGGCRHLFYLGFDVWNRKVYTVYNMEQQMDEIKGESAEIMEYKVKEDIFYIYLVKILEIFKRVTKIKV